MSTLQINNIRPYSGNTLTISGSFVDAPGVLTVETSITSSGDTRFPNVGTGVVNPVSSSLAASGTSSLNPTGPSTTNTTTFLDYAIRNDVSGVWGGTTTRERMMMRRSMGIKVIPISLREVHVGT